MTPLEIAKDPWGAANSSNESIKNSREKSPEAMRDEILLFNRIYVHRHTHTPSANAPVLSVPKSLSFQNFKTL